MREKLIELLDDALLSVDWEMDYYPNTDEVSNILISNGVTIPVRCKDCCYGRPIDKTRSPEKYFKVNCVVCECEEVVGDEPMIYEPTHFCSYGERKDK